jgi:hypothetical protein
MINYLNAATYVDAPGAGVLVGTPPEAPRPAAKRPHWKKSK